MSHFNILIILMKTIYNLDAISNYSIYSKFNVNFTRIFGDRSLKGFVKINKKSKTLKKLNYLEEIDKKFPKITAKKDIEPYDYINKKILQIEENNNNLNKNKSKYDKILKSEPNNYKRNYFNSKKKKIDQIINLDPFKYNPNYNAIYKKIPYVRIIEPKYNENNNNSSKKNISKNNISKISNKSINKSKSKSKINNSKEEEENNNSNDNDNDNENNISKNSNKNNKDKLPLVNINRYDYRNENHALRFSKYGNPRIHISRNENKICPIYYNKSYIKHNIKKKKKINAINFDKMMSRKDTDFVNCQSLNTPSFNLYSPNYDFVKNSSNKISFSRNHIDNDLNKKKYFLRKLITSYNVDSEFHIFNTDRKYHNNTTTNNIE